MKLLKHPDCVFIGGEWQPVTRFEDIVNPATERHLFRAPVASPEQVDAAIGAARAAFDESEWPWLSPHVRQAAMTRFLDLIEARKQDVIDLIVAEAGATRLVAEHVQYGIPMGHARRSVELANRPDVTSLPLALTPNATGATTLGTGVITREPLGVVAAISPYNFPFFLNIGKVVAALVMGCTVVLKPSPYTPAEALILGEFAVAAGLPAGIFSVVTGDVEAGRLLSTDPRVDLVHFTGSDKVGSQIQAQAAPTLKRIVMELGGKSALIVRHDADLNAAAMAGFASFTMHCGQGCGLTTRHIVHNAVRKEYVDLLKGMVAGLKIGDPADPDVTYGPLIREVARSRTEEYVRIAQDEGATLVFGGKRPPGFEQGFFFEPTVFDNVDNKSRLAQEEVFGPVGAVIGFDDDAEAIAMANDSNFGLAGAVFSSDAGAAYRLARRIRTGNVAINGGAGTMLSDAPYGGIKRSGYGRENGVEGLNEFTYQKVVHFQAA